MIIVTGACGFLGSNIIAELSEKELHGITAIDYFQDADKWKNLAKQIIADFVPPEQTIAFLEKNANQVECIIHMASSNITDSQVDLHMKINVHNSTLLWDWCTLHKVPFIYASCASTYGQIVNTACKDDDSIEALANLRPLTPYAWSKNAADLVFSQRAAANRMPPSWFGLKFFSVYGPNEYHKGESRSVITKFYEDAKVWDAVTLFKSDREDIEDGQQKRDFVYVKDCAKAVVWFLENKDKAGSGIYNIGTGNARSFIEVAKAMEKPMGKTIEFSFKDMPEDIKNTYQYYTQANMDKARAAGLNVSFRSLEAGIADFIENYLSKPDIYR